MVGRLGVNGGRARQLVALENNIEKDLVPNLVRIMAEKHALERARRPDTATLTLVQVCTSQSLKMRYFWRILHLFFIIKLIRLYNGVKVNL